MDFRRRVRRRRRSNSGARRPRDALDQLQLARGEGELPARRHHDGARRTGHPGHRHVGVGPPGVAREARARRLVRARSSGWPAARADRQPAPEQPGRARARGDAPLVAPVAGRRRSRPPARPGRVAQLLGERPEPARAPGSASTGGAARSTGARPAHREPGARMPERHRDHDGHHASRLPVTAAGANGASRMPDARACHHPRMLNRADAIDALAGEPFDVLVIGGGITGAGRRAGRRHPRLLGGAGGAGRLRDRAPRRARASSSTAGCATCRTSTSGWCGRRCWSARSTSRSRPTW